MMKLAAFADEIAPNLDQQIKSCRENGVTHFELRGVYGKNVLDFDAPLRAEIKTRLADNGLAVLCIASPIGKVTIDQPWPAHFDRFKIAVELAEYFSAPFIRIFSYYPPKKGESMTTHRQQVIDRMREKVQYVGNRPITLIHENEKDIYGEKGAACLDILKTINSPKLRCAFDFANFVQAGEHPINNWPMLKPYTVHIHVKDALLDGGKVVPAGEGDGDILPILLDLKKDNYNGFLSLEPHLSAAGQFSGFAGPKLFKVAADALKDICKKNGIALEGNS